MVQRLDPRPGSVAPGGPRSSSSTGRCRCASTSSPTAGSCWSPTRKRGCYLEADGTLASYADLSPLATGCNDLVVDGRGNAYVNSPVFDFAVGPPDGDVQPGLVQAGA